MPRDDADAALGHVVLRFFDGADGGARFGDAAPGADDHLDTRLTRGPDGTPMLTRLADIVEVNRRRDVLGPGGSGSRMLERRAWVARSRIHS